jgi:aminoglycoside phosphotransferase (APT) family kinase protein
LVNETPTTHVGRIRPKVLDGGSNPPISTTNSKIPACKPGFVYAGIDDRGLVASAADPETTLNQDSNTLTQFDLDCIANQIAPGAAVVALDRLEGGVSATITLLELQPSNGEPRKVVVRQYGPSDLADNPRIPDDEFALLDLLRSRGMPVPQTLLSTIGFGEPAITCLVVEFIEGSTILEPPLPNRFAEQIAMTLSAFHCLHGTLPELRFLPDAVVLALMTMEVSSESAFLTLHECRYWKLLANRRFPRAEQRRTLVHGDFWPGNLLCKDGALAAVIDWEDAATGDPVQDVSNCRLELHLAFTADTAQHFNDCYQRLNPAIDFTSICFWDLYAAANTLGRISTWGLPEGDEQRMVSRARDFASTAYAKLSSS